MDLLGYNAGGSVCTIGKTTQTSGPWLVSVTFEDEQSLIKADMMASARIGNCFVLLGEPSALKSKAPCHLNSFHA